MAKAKKAAKPAKKPAKKASTGRNPVTAKDKLTPAEMQTKANETGKPVFQKGAKPVFPKKG